AEMAGNVGKVSLLVGKGRFDDEVLQVLNTVDDVPQLVVRSRVACEDKARCPAIHVIADRWNGMPCRDGRNGARAERYSFADFDLAIAQEWSLGTGKLGEIRPHCPVEEMVSHDLERAA